MADAPAGDMVSAAMFHGQPCIEISLSQGDRVCIALHGAHVLSWKTADGAEHLYLSPLAKIDGASPIRGGVPICFPQFNQRVLANLPLPKHGFARTQPWTVLSVEQSDVQARAVLQLCSNEVTRAVWPHEFVATLTVKLESGHLQITFDVENSDLQPWAFALALHSYLRVGDIARSHLNGLQGLRYWDGVQNLTQPEVRHAQSADPVDGILHFVSETDRVYEDIHSAAAPALALEHPGARLEITQSASLSEVVVWNPGAALSASLDDLPNDGYKQMLCVEAACINAPVTLAAGRRWSGWQHLAVADVQPDRSTD